MDNGLWPQRHPLAFFTISRCQSPAPMLQGPQAYIRPLQQGAVLSHLANVASPGLGQVDRPVAWQGTKPHLTSYGRGCFTANPTCRPGLSH